jgi:hypothetical protein
VPGVPGGFLDHVQDDPSQVDGLARGRPAPDIPARITAARGRIKRGGRDDGVRAGDLVVVEAEDIGGRHLRPDQPAGVVGYRELDRLPGGDAAEPVPLVVHGEMVDQPEAGPARWEHRAPERGLWQAVDDLEHGGPLLIEVVDQALGLRVHGWERNGCTPHGVGAPAGENVDEGAGNHHVTLGDGDAAHGVLRARGANADDGRRVR